MKEKIEEILGKQELTAEMCSHYELEPFNKENFKELEMLGEGSFGRVMKCLEKTNRQFVAVKFMKLQGNRDVKLENMASFLIEKQILKKFEKSHESDSGKYDLLPRFSGAYFNPPNGIVNELILVSEAGNFNLDELIKCRKKDFKNNPPYSPEEVFNFLIHILPAFTILQELGLYHSDIKTQNIVFSSERKGFMLIDFGVSMNVQIDEQEGEIPGVYSLEDLGGSGTEYYMSPEKKKNWASDPPYKKEDTEFNPFACDIWSLGVIIEEMLAGNTSCLEDHKISEIFKGIRQEDWRNRWTADRILKFLEENNVNLESDMESQEGKYIEKLKDQLEKKEGLLKLQKKYELAELPKEQLEISQKIYKEIVDQNPDKSYNDQIFEKNYEDLGFYLCI